MKAICITQYKNLADVFDLGDEVEIESILSTEEEIIKFNRMPTDHLGRMIEQKNAPYFAPIVIPKGNFIDVRIKSKNGGFYTGVSIRNTIGYVPLDKIFKKI